MRPNHPIDGKKLTKRYFMSLREGKFLVGNVCDHHYRPAFAERVAPKVGREEQWDRIKCVRADGRICDLFKDERAFRWLARRKDQSAKRHGYQY